jgi:uncharacterized protein with HEPN domain
LDSAKLAVSYITQKSRADFLGNIQCQDAVIRRIIIIGEAANRVSEETQQNLNHLPWRKMVGMRNIVVHEYDDVNLNIIWDTLQIDLPILIGELEKLLPS